MIGPGWRVALRLLPLAAMLLAGVMVVRALSGFTWQQVRASVALLDIGHIGAGLLCTAGSYLALSGFDQLAMRYVGVRPAFGRVMLAAFVSLSIGHTAGLAPLSSGAVRYRFYSRWGLSLAQVGQVMLFSAVTVGLGELALAGVALLVRPALAVRLLDIDAGAVRAVGLACAGLPAGYVVAAALCRRPLGIGRWRMALPGWRLALGQVALGGLNFALVAGALYQVLLATGPVDYFTVATAFLAGNLAALLSHVPGGLGVLEAVVLALLPQVDALGAVIAFRVIYYWIPLAAGLVLLAIAEAAARVAARRAPASPPAPGRRTAS